jgi:hypothetical protein
MIIFTIKAVTAYIMYALARPRKICPREIEQIPERHLYKPWKPPLGIPSTNGWFFLV